MKTLFLHSTSLHIEAAPANKQRRTIRNMRAELGDALMPILDERNRDVRVENVLLLLVCVEHGDEKLALGPIVADVLTSRKMIGVPEIVISAFAHLSERPAPPGIAIEVIGALVREVRAAWPDTCEAPFGYDKSFGVFVPAHHYAASFKSYQTSNYKCY